MGVDAMRSKGRDEGKSIAGGPMLALSRIVTTIRDGQRSKYCG